MSLRLKLVMALGLLGMATTLAIGALSYRSTTVTLRDSIDESLKDAARRLPLLEFPRGERRLPRLDRSFERVLLQRLDTSGTIIARPRSGDLPVDDIDRAVAAGDRRQAQRDITLDQEPFRLLTISTSEGAAQLARSQREVEEISARIRRQTATAAVLVGASACLLGWLLATQLTRRLSRLTTAATDVAATGKLDTEVPVAGSDETAQLATAFNEMLRALARSKAAQHDLVQDAGHELRTPLTSLRTNVSVLQRYDALPPDQRAQVLADIDSESRELTDLVNELVQLATDQRSDEPVSRVRVADVCEAAADRARRRHNREIAVDTDDSVVDGRPNALDRAVHNIIDNAAKFAPEGPIEVVVRNGQVSVSDRGPGLGADDATRLFDRFYRADSARSLPGSGLGLAIVREIVESHGGTVFAASRSGGGATIGFNLPLSPPSES
jgi:two-component system sensor histidine kinase MprB